MTTKWMGVAMGLTLMLSGGVFAKSKDKKLCQDLGQLKSSLTALDSLPADATLGQVKASTSQVREAGREVAKEAAQDKDAQNLNMAINDLRQTVSNLPAGSGSEMIKSQIEPQVKQVRTATRQFAATYCH